MLEQICVTVSSSSSSFSKSAQVMFLSFRVFCRFVSALEIASSIAGFISSALKPAKLGKSEYCSKEFMFFLCFI